MKESIADYQVIIIGCGPAGAAAAIELGMQNIKTLVLEKYNTPLLSPRAQYLNSRTVSLLKRWGVLDNLSKESLLGNDFPQRTIWQNDLKSNPIAVGNVKSKGLRIPLYITENILRQKLSDFPSVTLLKNHEVVDVEVLDDTTKISVINENNLHCSLSSNYVIACDGANSIVRQKCKIPFLELGPKRQMLSILFKTNNLKSKIKNLGMMHLCLTKHGAAAIGPIDLRTKEETWYAQIPYPFKELPSKEQADEILDEVAGLKIEKNIINYHLWQMQVQIAEYFTYNQKVFLISDSAHAFAPTGGFGLNTGFGDVTNLCWKIASVIHKQQNSNILSTYESERRPVAIHNLHAAEQNAQDRVLEKGSIQKLAEISDKQVNARHITHAYAYLYSSLTKLNRLQPLDEIKKNNDYIAHTDPGYFLPEVFINKKSIYEMLSRTQWSLLIIGNHSIDTNLLDKISILKLPEDTYPHKYILLRPDWHISATFENLPENISLPYNQIS
ncbi:MULTISPECIES: FAD-dependent monooxygenase [unclassified Francisella]|uniref:FAD-dependent monooxygenase n=1 Tax=unclassified Francisella TaxID=2610885 RepID=UPI002E334EB5|nr:MULTISPECIES: FAD-dependent monooxygenase [unclassified Francisella]MED7819373.1 FAD-dependent monooxygenase [Francisella sp. 19S2-4]MED7830170.1 FAD-dependent monooxygenase [Francisella sp. 19S2-10]